MEARLVFSLLSVRLGKRFSTILNSSTFFCKRELCNLSRSCCFCRASFFTHHTVNINNARRVHHKAPKSFLRKVSRCIFTDRDFLTVYRAFSRNFVILLAITAEGRNSWNSAKSIPLALCKDKRRRRYKLRRCKSNAILGRADGNGLSSSESCIKMRASFWSCR